MNKLIAFCLGAAAGSLLTWKIIEKKYKDLADEEIESVIDHYRMKEKLENNIGKKVDLKDDKVEANPEKMTEEEYNKLTSELGYDFSKEDGVIITKEKDGSVYMEPATDFVKPYVISPDEFGEQETYETKSWTLYTDGVITDEVGNIIYDPEDIVGDALEHFGEFEDDAVHVRNENTECDYEIIKYPRAFSELNRGIINDLST